MTGPRTRVCELRFVIVMLVATGGVADPCDLVHESYDLLVAGILLVAPTVGYRRSRSYP